MKTALVMGGTRFFGKHLVEKLLEQGIEVTVATRGLTEDPFGDRVQRIRVDRTNAEEMKDAFADKQYDVVYDNICYTPHEAMMAINAFQGKVGRYIFTSTLSVYEYNEAGWSEEGFDPYNYLILLKKREDYDYREGKRESEAVFFQKADFPVVAVRFPIVLGTDDYTRRLHFHVEHIANEQEFGLPNQDARMVFITAAEAGEFLAFLGDSRFQGPINACSTGVISLRDLIHLIEEEVGKTARVVSKTEEREHMSPYGIEQNWYMVANKAAEIGFTFRTLQDYLPQLIRDLHKQA
jgi:nucleoside-diphosphate-sugar epimerase